MIFKCVYFLIFSSILLFASLCIGQETKFTPAERIDEQSKFGPQNKTSSRSRKEGWALVDYVISKNGSVNHIMVSASSEDYIDEGKAFVEAFKFSPATLNNKPITTTNSAHIDFGISFTGNSNNGVLAGYSKRFEAIKTLILQGKLDEAKPNLLELVNKYTKNTTEQALSAWLQSLYYYNTQEFDLYEKNLYKASYLKSKLPSDFASMVLENLMQLQISKNQFADARHSLLLLGNIKNKILYAETLAQIDSDFNAQIDQTPTLEINGVLHEFQSWRHRMNKSQFELSSQNGGISSAGLYCENGFVKFNDLSDISYKIPSDSGICILSVKGNAGTQLLLSESGENRYGKTL